MDNRRRTWAEIDIAAIKNNVSGVKKLLKNDTLLMTVVKANAYGHGLLQGTRACLEAGADYLGVATLEEALLLREAGITEPILLLGYLPEEYAEMAIKRKIDLTVFSLEGAIQLAKTASRINGEASIHLKIDTGMSRIGFLPDKGSLDIISEIYGMPGLNIKGIFTHLAVADIKDKTFSRQQLDKFSTFIKEIEKREIFIPLKHMANSAAILDLPETQFNMVRAGIICYGLYPSQSVMQNKLHLIPAMKVMSKIVQLKTIETGVSVSYGRTYISKNTVKVATVPIGYADGYSRILSNRAWAVVRGKKVPLIGTVCMDQCMFDVSEVKDVTVGDEIILLGKKEDGISADDLAEIMGTINYEIICTVGARVPRIYKK